MILLRQNVALLRQGIDLLTRLDAGRYGPRDGVSGVGAHLRHCIDFYRCLLDGAAGGRVDYDARSRDPAIEAHRRAASAALEELVAGLEALEVDPGRALEVKVDTAAGTEACWHRSSLGRELQFLISHTTHHYALIALLLRARGFELPADFGVAPSTLAHQQQEAASCAQ